MNSQNLSFIPKPNFQSNYKTPPNKPPSFAQVSHNSKGQKIITLNHKDNDNKNQDNHQNKNKSGLLGDQPVFKAEITISGSNNNINLQNAIDNSMKSLMQMNSSSSNFNSTYNDSQSEKKNNDEKNYEEDKDDEEERLKKGQLILSDPAKLNEPKKSKASYFRTNKSKNYIEPDPRYLNPDFAKEKAVESQEKINNNLKRNSEFGLDDKPSGFPEAKKAKNKPQLCMDYLNRTCEFGDDCKRIHATEEELATDLSLRELVSISWKSSENQTSKKKKSGEICRHFAKLGRCKYGNSCRFVHVESNEIKQQTKKIIMKQEIKREDSSMITNLKSEIKDQENHFLADTANEFFDVPVKTDDGWKNLEFDRPEQNPIPASIDPVKITSKNKTLNAKPQATEKYSKTIAENHKPLTSLNFNKPKIKIETTSNQDYGYYGDATYEKTEKTNQEYGYYGDGTSGIDEQNDNSYNNYYDQTSHSSAYNNDYQNKEYDVNSKNYNTPKGSFKNSYSSASYANKSAEQSRNRPKDSDDNYKNHKYDHRHTHNQYSKSSGQYKGKTSTTNKNYYQRSSDQGQNYHQNNNYPGYDNQLNNQYYSQDSNSYHYYDQGSQAGADSNYSYDNNYSSSYEKNNKTKYPKNSSKSSGFGNFPVKKPVTKTKNEVKLDKNLEKIVMPPMYQPSVDKKSTKPTKKWQTLKEDVDTATYEKHPIDSQSKGPPGLPPKPPNFS